MTTLHDLPTNAILDWSLRPTLYEEAATGQAVDLREGDGSAFFLVAGEIDAATEPTAVALSESNDQTTWTAVAGANVPSLATNFRGVQASRFRRTKRYVRAAIAPGAGFEGSLSILIGQQKKSV
jgi:hypothetical protein